MDDGLRSDHRTQKKPKFVGIFRVKFDTPKKLYFDMLYVIGSLPPPNNPMASLWVVFDNVITSVGQFIKLSFKKKEETYQGSS